jgi:predicted dehydrogenase
MKTSTRRGFLADSVLAAAMAAAMPASSLLADDKKKAPKKQPAKKSPGELLHVAIVGAGGRGGEHIGQFLNHPNTEITCIVDVDEKIGRRRAAEVGKSQGREPKVVRDLREAFDDKSIDIVSTATPNHWHSLCAIWAMQAGKDVYVEKPVSHNVSEGRRMVETARKYNRICQAGTQCRSMQGTIDAIAYLKAGKIGEVKLARGLCYKRRTSIGPKGNYQVPTQVDFDLWCGPARKLPLTRRSFHYDWHWQREWGNGDMGNQGPHQMDIARWGLGLDRLADSVISYGGRLGYVDAGDVANTEVGIFEFGDKTLVFEVRGLATDPLRGASVGVIFYGSEGYVVLDSYTGGAAFDPKGKLVTKFHGGADRVHFDNFVQAVKARDPKILHADILEGHLSCAHSHLANVSYYLGKPATVDEIKATVGKLKTNEDVADCLSRTLAHLTANSVDLAKTPLSLGPMLKIDSKNETVLDNPAACALLTREYRKPFVVPAAGEV